MKEPIKPVNRPVQTEIIFVDDNKISLQEIIDLVKKNNLEPKDVFIEADLDNNWGDFYSKLNIYYYNPEYTEKEFEKKIEDYKIKRKEYKKWLKEEFPKIEKERLNKEIAKLEEKKKELEVYIKEERYLNIN